MVLPNSIRLLIRVIAAVSLLFFSLFLLSCEEVGSFVEHLDDEVKLANNRYLEIIAVYPTQNDQEINPGVPLLITFDRAVNPETIQSGGWINVAIQDSLLNTKDFVDELDGALDMKFNSIDNTLTLSAFPYLSGGAKIIISLLAGMPASDGSVLRDSKSWSFYTGKLPAGSLTINDGVGPALPGYVGAPGPVGLTIDFSREVSEYYFTANHDPDGVADSLLITENDTVISDNWIEVSGDPPVTTESVNIPDEEDGVKSVFIRFYDYEEEAFSPIVEATTILDTALPEVHPEFKGSNRVNDAAFLYARAWDENGIQSDTYVWEADSPLPSDTSLIFGNPSASATSVYLFESPVQNKILAPIETNFSLRVTAVDAAGHSNIGITDDDLVWDRYVAQPDVSLNWNFTDNPDKYLQSEEVLNRVFDTDLHLISEYFLDEMHAYLTVDWAVDIGAIPNKDLEFFYMGVNDFVSPIRSIDFEVDKDLDVYFASNLQGFKYGPETKDLMPGYYAFTTTLEDDFGNQSDRGSDYVSFVSDSFTEILIAAKTWMGKDDVSGIWPYNTEGLNRYPSFSWPLMSKKIAELDERYKGVEYLYYKLMVNKKSPTEIIISDIYTPYWFHSGPDDFPALEARHEDGWWFEIWVDEDLDGTTGDESVFSSVEEFGGSFSFTTGLY